MNICSENHQEICHETRECPLCALRSDKDQDITDLQKKVDELRKEVSTLEDQIRDSDI
jgi:polyhydroxyalkanoate synthesis regulator phasin